MSIRVKSQARFPQTVLAALLVAGFSTGALATSVKISGLTDIGVAIVSNENGQPTRKVRGGNLSKSRISFNINEDISPDLSAGAYFSAGLNIANGDSAKRGTLFNRNSEVYLKSKKVGSIHLGNIDDVIDYLDDQVPKLTDRHIKSLTSPTSFDRQISSRRVARRIRYVSPNWSGVKVFLDYGTPGKTSVNGEEHTFSGGISYANDIWQLGAAHSFSRVKTSDINNVGTLQKRAFKDPGWAGFSLGSNHRYTLVRSSLVGEKWLLAATAGHATISRFDPLISRQVHGETARIHSDFGQIELTYKFNPTWASSIGYQHNRVYANNNSVRDARYHEVVSGVTYSLTKRTAIYLLGAYKHASGVNSFGTPAVAHLAKASPSTSSRQARVALGIRSKF